MIDNIRSPDSNPGNRLACSEKPAPAVAEAFRSRAEADSGTAVRLLGHPGHTDEGLEGCLGDRRLLPQ